MRDILFKAKRIDNGEWVIGNLIYSEDAEEGWEAIIIPTFNSNMFTKGGAKGNLGFENWYRVDKDTICQYTGLTDKNGNKIWEKDIIGFLDFSQYDNGYSEHYCVGQVLWYEETLSFEVTERISCESYEALDGDCDVIGNIFDNPELLEV